MKTDLPRDMKVNPYVARTFFRIDKVIYRLRGKETYWSEHLCHAIRRDGKFSHGVAVRSHFPDWMHIAACKLYRARPFFLARFFRWALNR